MISIDPHSFFGLSLAEQKKIVRFLVPSFDSMSYSGRQKTLCHLLDQFELGKYKNEIAEKLIEITRLCDVIPECHKPYRQIVHDGVLFLISQISDKRFIQMLAEQFLLDDKTTAQQRLLELVKHMPTLHKLGQIIARNQNVDASFRKWLIYLENGLHSVTFKQIKKSIDKELSAFSESLDVQISPTILAEASVAAVVPFILSSDSQVSVNGVFKILKPHVREYLYEELRILDELVRFYDRHRESYVLKDFPFGSTFEDVKTLLLREIEPLREQENLKLASVFFEHERAVKIPRVFALSTKTMTAMEQIYGWKVTDAPLTDKEKRQCCKQIFRTLIALPLFCLKSESFFHGDPHGGNIFVIKQQNQEDQIQIALLDWSLAGRLTRSQRYYIICLCFAILTQQEQEVYKAVAALSEIDLTLELSLSNKVKAIISKAFSNHIEYQWVRRAFSLIDTIAANGVRFPSDLLLFRKAVFTLEGLLQELDPEFDMDTYMMDFMTELFIEELPLRYWSMWFPLWEKSEHYKTLLSNTDLVWMLSRASLNSLL